VCLKEQAPQTVFTAEENQGDLRRTGERLVSKYMDEVAPTVEPAAVELDVQGEIAGVAVRGRVDVLDVDGRLIDFKTASRQVAPWVSFGAEPIGQFCPFHGSLVVSLASAHSFVGSRAAFEVFSGLGQWGRNLQKVSPPHPFFQRALPALPLVAGMRHLAAVGPRLSP
jgi:hypothetical protein